MMPRATVEGAAMGCRRQYGALVLERVNRALRAYCREKRVTQGAVAAQLGLSASALSQRVNGTIPLNTDYVLSVARLTGTPPGALAETLQGLVFEPKEVRRCAPR
jgi:transcriptional regulator with XRE-family HTH domain